MFREYNCARWVVHKYYSVHLRSDYISQATNEEELITALDKALEVGYRHIDTATLYQNEHIIGKVLKKWLDSGKIQREDLFIVTKVRYLPPSINLRVWTSQLLSSTFRCKD